MISFLRGKIFTKKKYELVLDVDGVGYHIFVSKSVFENSPELNSETTIITYLDIKENSMILYGFSDEKEKEIFKLLISVSGIGPKIAHTILSHLTFEEIIGLVSNYKNLNTKIPGIGNKKLELISMTLKDKIFKLEHDIKDFSEEFNSSNDQFRLDALNALINLGYVRSEAEKIIREVLKSNSDKNLTTEEILKKSFELMSK